MNQIPEQVKTAGDVAAGFVALGALAKILPPAPRWAHGWHRKRYVLEERL